MKRISRTRSQAMKRRKFVQFMMILQNRNGRQREAPGYDFSAPVAFVLKPGETIKIPTGIRARMDEDWVLCLFPRSGQGFKYRLQLNNTVGIIDSDYYNSDNEGHIMAKLTNDSNEGKVLEIHPGEGFLQGIFMPYGITEDDEGGRSPQWRI